MATERKAFALRLDPALYDAIARLANADLRSVNAEIEFLLREALRARGVKPAAEPDAEPS
ncbi:MAG: Arc family DNA-binding protein [Hyphomonadaceae bacterium]